MLPDIALEALRFFDRMALDGLQMNSRYLRDFVKRHASTLARRHIHHVEIAVGDIYIHLLKGDTHRTKVASPGEEELEVLFHRVNNAFIHELTLSFRRADLPLLHCLMGNADDLHCHIGALRIGFTAARIDYALVDFVGVHLKPQVFIYEMPSYWASFDEDYAMLFTHNALRGTVKHVVYELDGPAPDCLIPKLVGVEVVERCSIITIVDPRLWIVKFVEAFANAECGMDIVQSVTLIHARFVRFGDVSSFRHTVEPLGQPQRTDAPIPDSAFVKEWSRKERLLGSGVADLFVFENAKLARKLEVLVWTIGKHYAFLLRCI